MVIRSAVLFAAFTLASCSDTGPRVDQATRDAALAATVSLGPDSMMNVVIPSGSYRLDLRAGEKSASVRWSERIKAPLSPEAEQLRALARRIEEYLGAEAAYRRFPELGYGCL